jgi:hypothetical protein
MVTKGHSRGETAAVVVCLALAALTYIGTNWWTFEYGSRIWTAWGANHARDGLIERGATPPDRFKTFDLSEKGIRLLYDYAADATPWRDRWMWASYSVAAISIGHWVLRRNLATGIVALLCIWGAYQCQGLREIRF